MVLWRTPYDDEDEDCVVEESSKCDLVQQAEQSAGEHRVMANGERERERGW